MSTKIKVPGNLAFRKRLEPSKGILYGTSWENRRNGQGTPLTNDTMTVRGAKSHNKNFPADRKKGEAELGDANIHTLDNCLLAKDHDTVRLDYTLKILNGVAYMESCNDTEFVTVFNDAMEEMLDNIDVGAVAHRYATNIANGRPLWKNREALRIETVVTYDGFDSEWVFDGKKIPLHTFDYQTEDLTEMTSVIKDALLGRTDLVILQVSSFAQVGAGQPVFPSQEFIQDQGFGKKEKEGKKSKILYSPDSGSGFHPQKIGNAIRTIDTWYGGENSPSIAVEPFGAQTNFNSFHRSPYEKRDYYTLLGKMVNKEKLSLEESYFFISMMIRGGVFGKPKAKGKAK